MKEKLLIILGPTAVGKSGLAIKLAKRLRGEIVSADSMQAYKGLDIGTAKVPLNERDGVRHHLIDVIEPDERFSAGKFVKLAGDAINGILLRGNIPIIIGGTGLYMRAFLKGMFPSPPRNSVLSQRLQSIGEAKGTVFLHRMLRRIDDESARRIATNDSQRLIRALEIYFLSKKPMSWHIKESPFSVDLYDSIKIGLLMPRAKLYKRIEERVDKMFQAGWIEEVRELLSRGYSPECHAFKALGYREIVSYLKGKISRKEAKDVIKKGTRRYAKRQMTWFKKEEGVFWFDVSKGEDIVYKQVESLLCQHMSKICY